MTETSTAPPAPRSFLFAALSAGSAALLLLLQTIASHVLSNDDFGGFVWALRFATVAEALMDLGLHQATVRAIARSRLEAPTLFHNTLALKLITTSGMFGVMSVAALVLSEDQALFAVTLLMLVAAALRSYLLSVRGVYLGLERFATDAAIVIGDRVVLLAAGAAALWLGYGLFGLALAFLLARVAVVFVAIAATQRDLGRVRLAFDTALWRRLQADALPIGLFLLLLNVYSYADQLMLTALTSLVEGSLYGAAFILYEGLAYVPAILSSVLTPRLAALWKADRAAHGALTRQSIAGAMALSVLVALPFWLGAGPLLDLLFGADGDVPYSEAARTFRLLLGGLPFLFGLWVLQAVAMSVFRERMLLLTTGIGVVLNLGLNAMLIPTWGRDGAAAATLASEATTFLLLLFVLRDVVRRPAGDSGPHEASTEAFGNLESNLFFLDRHGRGALTGRVLEVGTGRGALLAHLRSSGCRVTGLDLNRALLAEARARHGALPVTQASAERLPFADGAFDTVLSFDVFEHLPDTDAHLREVRRVLAPGGVYLLQTPNKWTNSVFETIRWKSFTRWRADHCSLHTWRQLDERLTRHGFSVEYADVPVVTTFFRTKVRQHLGWPGLLLLAMTQPDLWPRSLRTNFYARASKERHDA